MGYKAPEFVALSWYTHIRKSLNPVSPLQPMYLTMDLQRPFGKGDSRQGLSYKSVSFRFDSCSNAGTSGLLSVLYGTLPLRCLERCGGLGDFAT